MIRTATNHAVILDLDETCLHTFRKFSTLSELEIMTDPKYLDLRERIYMLNIIDLYNKGDGSTVQMWGIIRPGVVDFLRFCFSYFKIVAVWSAGVEKYVHAAVDFLFTKNKLPRPNIIFSRGECLNEGTVENMILTKPIKSMIDSSLYLKDLMKMNNTFIIDDRIDYVKYNFQNAIVIPPYDPSPTIESMRNEDHALEKIMSWLLDPKVMFSKDVRKTRKDNIFSSSINKHPLDIKFEIFDVENIFLTQIRERNIPKLIEV